MQYELIRLKNELGITFIYVTHDQEEALTMSDTVVVMDAGKIVMRGTPKEVFSQVEKMKSYRLDVPQVTELAWELKKAGMPMPDGILTVEEFTEAWKKCQ